MVFYLKYRPQKIKELDSKEIRERLTSVLSAKDISHAFLFTGPKGLGKTSTARIVAKVLNCEARNKELGIKNKGKKEKAEEKNSSSDVEPCNKCSQCLSITNGSNMDILEIDAASNRGIDEIRDLKEKIRLLPAKASKKVYIIDEVHMLTTEAFNALLKTLEEPPSHAVFILCTTEPHKIPATILSRCFHLSFKKAIKEELVRAFERIAKEENLDIEKEVLFHIASLSDGSFRDGVKILEELVIANSDSGKTLKITKEMIEGKYQTLNINNQISKLLSYLEKKDIKNGFKLVSEMAEQGVDFKYFTEQMIDELHKMLLIEAGVRKSEQAEGWKMQDIKETIELFTKAHSELKYAILPQLPLEMAIIEYTNRSQNQEEENVGRLSHVANDSRRAFSKTSSSIPSSLSESRSKKLNQNTKEKAGSAFSSFASEQASLHSSAKADQARIDNSQRSINDEIDLWQELVLGVKPFNHSVAGVLRGCSLKSFDGKSLIIEAGYKFHKERLEDRKVKEIIEKVCKEITRKDVDVSIMLKKPA